MRIIDLDNAHWQRGISVFFQKTQLLQAPLKHTCTVVTLHDFQLHGSRLDRVEVNDVGCTLHRAVLCGVLHFCPLTGIGLVVEFPAVGNTATAPRTVIEPINGGGADGFWLLELVGATLLSFWLATSGCKVQNDLFRRPAPDGR